MIHVRVGCERAGMSLCNLLGMLHREHESVVREKLHSSVAGGFIGEAQLNASDLEQETMILVSDFPREQHNDVSHT